MITPVFPPRNTAGIFRTLRFSKYMSNFGWAPIICTMNSNDPKDFDPTSYGLAVDAEIIRFGKLSSSGDSPQDAQSSSSTGQMLKPVGQIRKYLRPFREYFFETPDKNIDWANLLKRKGLGIIQRTGAQLIYSSGPPHSSHLAALALSRSSRLPWIADFRDPWARKPWRDTRNPIGARLNPYYERSVIRSAHCVVLNNPSSLEDFQNAYPEYAEKLCCIPNGIDPAMQLQVQSVLSAVPKESRNPIPTIFHSGNLYGSRDPRPLIRAIASLNRKGTPVCFHQLGAVTRASEIEQEIASLNIGHLIEFNPPIPHSQALERMATADILTLIQPDASVMVPAKLFEMMLFKKPILAICDSPSTEQIVQEYGGGCAASRDIQQIEKMIVRALDQLSDNSSQDKRASTIDKYDGVNLTGQLVETMNRLVCR